MGWGRRNADIQMCLGRFRPGGRLQHGSPRAEPNEERVRDLTRKGREQLAFEGR